VALAEPFCFELLQLALRHHHLLRCSVQSGAPGRRLQLGLGLARKLGPVCKIVDFMALRM
jgi:hypothetical protein